MELHVLGVRDSPTIIMKNVCLSLCRHCTKKLHEDLHRNETKFFIYNLCFSKQVLPKFGNIPPKGSALIAIFT